MQNKSEKTFLDFEKKVNEYALNWGEQGLSFWIARTLETVYIVLTSVFYIVVTAVKLEMGVVDFFVHFTNWGWMFLTVFLILYTIGNFGYLFKKPSPLSDRNWNTFHFNLILWFFPIVWGVTWQIFWLVWVMLGTTDASLYRTFSLEQGGDFGWGDILLGDRVFHVLPLITVLLFTLLQSVVIGRAFVYAEIIYFRNSFLLKTVYFIFFGMILPTAPGFIYIVTHDVSDIYGVLSVPLAMVALLVSIVVFTAIPLATLVFSRGSFIQTKKEKSPTYNL